MKKVSHPFFSHVKPLFRFRVKRLTLSILFDYEKKATYWTYSRLRTEADKCDDNFRTFFMLKQLCCRSCGLVIRTLTYSATALQGTIPTALSNISKKKKKATKYNSKMLYFCRYIRTPAKENSWAMKLISCVWVVLAVASSCFISLVSRDCYTPYRLWRRDMIIPRLVWFFYSCHPYKADKLGNFCTIQSCKVI